MERELDSPAETRADPGFAFSTEFRVLVLLTVIQFVGMDIAQALARLGYFIARFGVELLIGIWAVVTVGYALLGRTYLHEEEDPFDVLTR